MKNKLADALKAVDWPKNVEFFLADQNATESISRSSRRLALWAKQFEIADHGNPALTFVREMQVSVQQVAAMVALGLYKGAAAGIRSIVEAALYYTYFRTHSAELATLARDRKFFVSKKELIEYHCLHTIKFSELQTAMNLASDLNQWYKDVSGIIHGQVPGGWVEHRSLADVKHVQKTLALVIGKVVKGEEIVHSLFLATVGQELWHDFAAGAKKELLAGLPGKVRDALSLDES